MNVLRNSCEIISQYMFSTERTPGVKQLNITFKNNHTLAHLSGAFKANTQHTLTLARANTHARHVISYKHGHTHSHKHALVHARNRTDTIAHTRTLTCTYAHTRTLTCTYAHPRAHTYSQIYEHTRTHACTTRNFVQARTHVLAHARTRPRTPVLHYLRNGYRNSGLLI